ncbi:hypothetical protein ACHAWF_006758 [Thalassiosira exigua]
MNKFLSNLGGGGDKKNKPNKNKQQQGRDGTNSGWQGGRSGDMESLKNKSASSRIVGGAGNKQDANGKGNNVFANAGAGLNDKLGKMDLFNKSTKSAKPRGGGQSLGGTKPGRVFSVSLDHPGPLGLEVERRKNAQATAIIAAVAPSSQADKAGLKRGDIVCQPNSNGNEYRYDQFIAIAKSGKRPLRFDVRRIESNLVSGGSTGGRGSVDSYARKQAVVAAAEAREAKHKATQKPIPKTGKRLDKPKQEKVYHHDQTVESEETRRAIIAAKRAEEEDAKNLGYNPYEAKAMTGGQARTATVAMTAGEMKAQNASSKMTGTGENKTELSSPGKVNKPKDPTAESRKPPGHPPSPVFEEAFSIVVTGNADNAAVLKSLKIMRTLITNATTKGQQGSDETSSKFRRVRLSNPKIKEAITDTQGALELMMSVGFVLSEHDEDGETYLVFPPGDEGPVWLGSALEMMESYAKGGS